VSSNDEDPAATRKRWQVSTVAVGAPRTARAGHTPFDPAPPRRFEEGEELGRGGMGRVYEAYDITLDRAVAIKQALHDDPGMLERFEREVMITAKLQHPGIVPILDAGRDEDGKPYFVMRKIEGQLLADRVDEAATARARLALVPSVLAAADAIAYAHARGVVHRDLKPWNVLLGPFGETLVIDWGLASVLDEPDLERAGAAYGTPGFMAPEQARGEPSDRRSDVYALGATLVHVLTGRSPFHGREPAEMIAASARGERPAIAVAGEIPVELTAIATKAMAPAAVDRYADAGELAADLRRFLAGQLVAAHAYTPRQRIARWIRRHRIAVMVGAVAFVALVGLGAVSLRGVIVARDAAQAARARESLRADAAIVERARTLAATDPTRALAILKQLPSDSAAWRRARDVAEAAVAAGPSWGFAAGIETPIASMLVASPTGARFAVSSDRAILVGEPSLRARPRLVTTLPARPEKLVWSGESVLIARCEDRLIRIDVATGIQRSLDAGGPAPVVIDPADARVFAIAGGRLRELDLDGGPPRRDLGAAREAGRLAGAIVYRAGDQILFQADGAAPVTIATGFDGFELGPGRIAIRNDVEVRELELGATGFVPRGTWHLREAERVSYVGDRLVARSGSSVAWLVPDRQPVWLALPIAHFGMVERGSEMFAAGTREGILAFGYDHIVHARAGHPPLEVAAFPDPIDSVVRAGSWFVALTVRGELRAWSLDQLVPPILELAPEIELLGISERRLWITGMENDGLAHLARIDLATAVGDTSTISPASRFVCESRDRAVFAVDHGIHSPKNEPSPLLVGDLPGFARPHVISRTARLVACDANAGVLVEAGAAELAVRRAPDLDTVVARFAIATPVLQVEATARWIATVDRAHVVTRIEIATGRRETIETADASAIALADDGRVAVLHPDAVELWPIGAPRLVIDHLRMIDLRPNPLGFVGQTATKQLVVISVAGEVTARIDVGVDVSPCLARDATTAYFSDNGRLATVDLRDGSSVTFPWPINTAVCSRDATAAVVRGRLSADAVVVKRVLPAMPAMLRGWLAATTNAVLAPGATEISWSR